MDKYGVNIEVAERNSQVELFEIRHNPHQTEEIVITLTHQEALNLRWKLDEVIKAYASKTEDPTDIEDEILFWEDEILKIQRTMDSRHSHKRINLIRVRIDALKEQKKITENMEVFDV